MVDHIDVYIHVAHSTGYKWMTLYRTAGHMRSSSYYALDCGDRTQGLRAVTFKTLRDLEIIIKKRRDQLISETAVYA
ncbi:hypothetical protein J6590_090741 [Homalodisca vitripennis]|nr:hypothetical protein J6590_090741 [Homalodisca vitripennis]